MKRTYVQIPAKCPYCGSKILRKHGNEVYDDHGKDYGSVYLLVCSKPNCDARTTCDSEWYPYGTMARKGLRDARIRAHEALDKFWEKKHYDRKSMYKLLAHYLKIEVDFCHIGLFDEQQCENVVQFCQKLGQFRISPHGS